MALPRWLIGVLINCLGSVAINLGTNLMKLSHKKRSADKRPTVDLDALEYQQLEQTRLLQHDGELDDKVVAVGASSGDTTDGLELPRIHTAGIAPKSKSSVIMHINDVGVSNSRGSADTGDRSNAANADVCGTLLADDWVHHNSNTCSAIDTMLASNGTRLHDVGNDSSADINSTNVHASSQQESGFPGLTRKVSHIGNIANTVKHNTVLPQPGLYNRTASSSINSTSSTAKSSLKQSTKDIQTLWYTGASSLGAGSILNFISMGFAPQSLLASLGSVQFISNVVFGKVILKETVTTRIVLGTATIIGGNVITVLYSPRQDANYNKADLVSFYDTDYQLLLLIELIAAVSMHMMHGHYRNRHARGNVLPATDIIMPLAYAICSAIIGTQSVIQAKCLSELLNMTVRGDNQLVYPFTYAVTVLWLSTTVFWLVRMNRALQQFHGLFIIPALQVFWSFFSIVGGGVYFEEFQELSDTELGVFTLGVFIVFTGVYIMAPKSTTTTAAQYSSALSRRHDSNKCDSSVDTASYGGSRTQLNNEYNASAHTNKVFNRRQHYDVLQISSNHTDGLPNAEVSSTPTSCDMLVILCYRHLLQRVLDRDVNVRMSTLQ
jgi:magnesium transporter